MLVSLYSSVAMEVIIMPNPFQMNIIIYTLLGAFVDFYKNYTLRFRAIIDAFFWLSDSIICNECFLCNDPNIGLSLNENTIIQKQGVISDSDMKEIQKYIKLNHEIMFDVCSKNSNKGYYGDNMD